MVRAERCRLTVPLSGVDLDQRLQAVDDARYASESTLGSGCSAAVLPSAVSGSPPP